MKALNAILKNLGACIDLIFHLVENIYESSSLILDTWMFIQTHTHTHVLTNTYTLMSPVRARFLDFHIPHVKLDCLEANGGRQKCCVVLLRTCSTM